MWSYGNYCYNRYIDQIVVTKNTVNELIIYQYHETLHSQLKATVYHFKHNVTLHICHYKNCKQLHPERIVLVFWSGTRKCWKQWIRLNWCLLLGLRITNPFIDSTHNGPLGPGAPAAISLWELHSALWLCLLGWCICKENM